MSIGSRLTKIEALLEPKARMLGTYELHVPAAWGDELAFDQPCLEHEGCTVDIQPIPEPYHVVRHYQNGA